MLNFNQRTSFLFETLKRSDEENRQLKEKEHNDSTEHQINSTQK